MASYHLSLKTVKRSASRSSTAAAAYPSAEHIACVREGRVHDYTCERDVQATMRQRRARVGGLGKTSGAGREPEGAARLDQGDHTASEGVPEWAKDRVALMQARLFDYGELFGREDLPRQGRALYHDLAEAQFVDEGAERERDLGTSSTTAWGCRNLEGQYSSPCRQGWIGAARACVFFEIGADIGPPADLEEPDRADVDRRGHHETIGPRTGRERAVSSQHEGRQKVGGAPSAALGERSSTERPPRRAAGGRGPRTEGRLRERRRGRRR